jgi:hypothetical protein
VRVKECLDNARKYNPARMAARLRLLVAFASCAAGARAAAATPALWPWAGSQRIIFPEGYNYFDAKNASLPKGGARGDGVTDDTDALQAAINATGAFRVLYLPAGAYVISRPLVWPSNKLGVTSRSGVVGEDVATTTIVLKDASAAFQDVTRPAAMLSIGDGVAQNFFNRVENLAFSTGAGNCGATALRFDANNMGAVRNVSLASGDASGCGSVGLDFSYSDQIGPLLAKWVHVTGFSAGVAAAHNVDSQTLEHVWVAGFLRCGVCNLGQVLTVRDLTAVAAAPGAVPVESACFEAGVAMLTLVDATLVNAGPAALPVGVNSSGGILFARNITLVGAFDFAIVHTPATLPPPSPPPPPPPPPGCDASFFLNATAGKGKYLAQSTQPDAGACCAAAAAFNARAPPAPCVLWTLLGSACTLHSTAETYARPNATSGALAAAALAPPWPACGATPAIKSAPVQCVNGSAVAEWTSAPVVTLFPGAPATSLNLPVAADPEPAWPAPAAWAPALAADASGFVNCSQREEKNCLVHGANVTCWLPDCSALLQRAMDAAGGAGAGALFFPAFSAKSYLWSLAADVRVPEAVTRLDAGGAPLGSASPDTQIVVADGTAASAPLVIERWVGADGGAGVIAHASARPVVLRDMAGWRYAAACDTPGGVGDVFIDDLVSGPLQFCAGQRVWVRQLNTENAVMDVNVSGGAALWVLGMKTERGFGGLLNVSGAGSAAEVLGLFVYSTDHDAQGAPAFSVNGGARLAATYREYNANCNPFNLLVEESPVLLPARVLSRNFSVPGVVPGHGASGCPTNASVGGDVRAAGFALFRSLGA